MGNSTALYSIYETCTHVELYNRESILGVHCACMDYRRSIATPPAV